MAYTVLFFNEVKQDIKEAKNWYHQQLKGLEHRFAEDIKTAIVRIGERPYALAIRYKNIRIAHPDIFPYSIHYYINHEENTIVITAIVHNNRNPPFAQGRTDP